MKKQPYRIVLADDHTMFRQGIKRLIEELPDMEVLGEVSDGIDLLNLLKKLKPDMAIVDITMPRMGGVEATHEICQLYPQTKVLILTMHRRIEYVHHAFSAGASGYLLKEDSGSELATAIKAIRNGGHYVTHRLATELAEDLSQLYKNNGQRTAETLTMRERSIVKLIAEGNTSRKIADILCISHRTVQNHRFHIMQKLNIGSTADMVKYAIDKGFV